jgi:enoyl-CoA hydratase/carnithine racemase
MSDRIVVTMDGGVADVRLNRPDKMNALDSDMFRALNDLPGQLNADPTVRAVVLSGEGRAFCAGLDFGGFMAMAGSSDESGGSANADDGAPETAELGDMGGRITHYAQQAVYGFTQLNVPVIAAVHGVALGGGAQLALGADMRVMTPDARLSILEIRWGIIPDMTGTQRLIELVGLDVAKELTFTGRMVEGTEARELGLTTYVADDPHAHAMGIAQEIAGKSPHAVQAAKRLFATAGRVSEAEGFANERHEINQLIGSPNQVEAVTAYFEKRDADYSNV